jgi:hypothetical protein
MDTHFDVSCVAAQTTYQRTNGYDGFNCPKIKLKKVTDYLAWGPAPGVINIIGAERPGPVSATRTGSLPRRFTGELTVDNSRIQNELLMLDDT